MNWNDFNSAAEQKHYDIIPRNILVKVRMVIKAGGYNDESQGWTEGYATRNDKGSVYLNCEFIVLEGPYAQRKIWSLIGLYSPHGSEWAAMGRSFIRGILNSARGVSSQDNSPEAQAARCIKSFADLDGTLFIGKVDVSEDRHGDSRNELRIAITPDHKAYAALMMGQQGIQTIQDTPHHNKPSWT